MEEEMKECKFFGFDKNMLSIYEGSIISFTHLGKKKIGHLWYWTGNNPSWVISFNHLYSETNMNLDNTIRNIRVIGYGDRDENLLKGHFER
jgi:hypothetical protein